MGANGEHERASAELLQWSTARSANQVSVVLEGEVDLSTADVLSNLLAEVLAERPRKVVVDLAGVSFLDSTGIKCLLAAQTAAAYRRLPAWSSGVLPTRSCESSRSAASRRPCWKTSPATRRWLVSIVTVSDRSIYSIGALARMLGVSPATLAVVGGSVRAGRARAQCRVAAAVLPRPPRPAAVRARADAARPERRRRASSAGRTPRRESGVSAPIETSPRNAGSCSSSATRTRPSSPSTSCAPRVTTSTSCGPSPMPNDSFANRAVDLGDRGSHDRGRRRPRLCRTARRPRSGARGVRARPARPRPRRRCASVHS